MGRALLRVDHGGLDQQPTEAYALMQPINLTFYNVWSVLRKGWCAHIPRCSFCDFKTPPGERKGALTACQLFYEPDVFFWVHGPDADQTGSVLGLEALVPPNEMGVLCRTFTFRAPQAHGLAAQDGLRKLSSPSSHFASIVPWNQGLRSPAFKRSHRVFGLSPAFLHISAWKSASIVHGAVPLDDVMSSNAPCSSSNLTISVWLFRITWKSTVSFHISRKLISNPADAA